jgi:hypothetical protein
MAHVRRYRVLSKLCSNISEMEFGNPVLSAL